MSKRLLVVDDEPNLLRAVAACLKAENYEVSTARSGTGDQCADSREPHQSHSGQKGFSNRVEIARYVFEQPRKAAN